jgi:hypothetical protein
MSLRVVPGSGGSDGEDPVRSDPGPRSVLHLVPLPTPTAAAATGGGRTGRHRGTTFAVTVDDLIVRECATPAGRTSVRVMALAVRRGLLPGCL